MNTWCRWPFHAQCNVPQLDWITGDWTGSPELRHTVVKRFKKKDTEHQRLERYIDMMHQSAICIVLARDFNARVKTELALDLSGHLPLYYNRVRSQICETSAANVCDAPHPVNLIELDCACACGRCAGTTAARACVTWLHAQMGLASQM